MKIVDGDTITILDAQNTQHKIRLQGIDAPESNQAFGQVSKQNLANLVFGKTVSVEYTKIDWRERLIGKVNLDGRDQCLEQIKAGLAWHYREYEKEQTPTDRALYEIAERDARSYKYGVWQDPNPIPPWDFRHHKNGSYTETELKDEAEPANHGVNDNLALPHPNQAGVSAAIDRAKSENATPNMNSAPIVEAAGGVRGNKRSRIYHWAGCPDYDKIALHNRVPFTSRTEAESAGYRAARNCP